MPPGVELKKFSRFRPVDPGDGERYSSPATPSMTALIFLSLALVWPLEAKSHSLGDHVTTMAEEESAPDDGKLADAVSELKDLGIVTDPDYWLENARKGRTCDGGMVAELLINAAGKFQPTDNLEAAVKVLQENKILENKEAGDFWEKKAVQGTKCNGRFVGLILVQIAKVL